MALNHICLLQGLLIAALFLFAWTAETPQDAFDDQNHWYLLYTSLLICAMMNTFAAIAERGTKLRLTHACLALIQFVGIPILENHESWQRLVAVRFRAWFEQYTGARIDQLLLATLWVYFTYTTVLLDPYDNDHIAVPSEEKHVEDRAMQGEDATTSDALEVKPIQDDHPATLQFRHVTATESSPSKVDHSYKPVVPVVKDALSSDNMIGEHAPQCALTPTTLNLWPCPLDNLPTTKDQSTPTPRRALRHKSRGPPQHTAAIFEKVRQPIPRRPIVWTPEEVASMEESKARTLAAKLARWEADAADEVAHFAAADARREAALKAEEEAMLRQIAEEEVIKSRKAAEEEKFKLAEEEKFKVAEEDELRMRTAAEEEKQKEADAKKEAVFQLSQQQLRKIREIEADTEAPHIPSESSLGRSQISRLFDDESDSEPQANAAVTFGRTFQVPDDIYPDSEVSSPATSPQLGPSTLSGVSMPAEDANFSISVKEPAIQDPAETFVNGQNTVVSTNNPKQSIQTMERDWHYMGSSSLVTYQAIQENVLRIDTDDSTESRQAITHYQRYMESFIDKKVFQAVTEAEQTMEQQLEWPPKVPLPDSPQIHASDVDASPVADNGLNNIIPLTSFTPVDQISILDPSDPLLGLIDDFLATEKDNEPMEDVQDLSVPSESSDTSAPPILSTTQPDTSMNTSPDIVSTIDLNLLDPNLLNACAGIMARISPATASPADAMNRIETEASNNPSKELDSSASGTQDVDMTEDETPAPAADDEMADVPAEQIDSAMEDTRKLYSIQEMGASGTQNYPQLHTLLSRPPIQLATLPSRPPLQLQTLPSRPPVQLATLPSRPPQQKSGPHLFGAMPTAFGPAQRPGVVPEKKGTATFKPTFKPTHKLTPKSAPRASGGVFSPSTTLSQQPMPKLDPGKAKESPKPVTVDLEMPEGYMTSGEAKLTIDEVIRQLADLKPGEWKDKMSLVFRFRTWIHEHWKGFPSSEPALKEWLTKKKNLFEMDRKSGADPDFKNYFYWALKMLPGDLWPSILERQKAKCIIIFWRSKTVIEDKDVNICQMFDYMIESWTMPYGQYKTDRIHQPKTSRNCKDLNKYLDLAEEHLKILQRHDLEHADVLAKTLYKELYKPGMAELSFNTPVFEKDDRAREQWQEIRVKLELRKQWIAKNMKVEFARWSKVRA